MITETELQYLTKAYEAGRKARFAVSRDEAWLDIETGIPMEVPLAAISKFLNLTVIAEDSSEPDNSITYYRITPRGYQVVDNPENINQLTSALFF